MLTEGVSSCLIEFFCRQFFDCIKNHILPRVSRRGSSIGHRSRGQVYRVPSILLFRWNFQGQRKKKRREKFPTERRLTSNTPFRQFLFLFLSLPFISFPIFSSSSTSSSYLPFPPPVRPVVRAETYVFAVRRDAAFHTWFARVDTPRPTTFSCNRRFRSFQNANRPGSFNGDARTRGESFHHVRSLIACTISIEYAVHSLCNICANFYHFFWVQHPSPPFGSAF